MFHHGISKRELGSGIIPMRDANTSVIGLIAFSNDADEFTFPLNTPALITSINQGIADSGTEGNLRSSLEAIAAMTSPTLVVVRIQDPFTGQSFDQSKVIGTTLDTGQRIGIQALLTAKSILGLTPKIIIAPDVEAPSVTQALAAVCKKLRAFAYVTPRDEFGLMLQTMPEVTTYRNTLSDREIMLIWPEFTNGNVLQPKPKSEISCAGATNTVSMHRAILIDQNESTVVPEDESLIINGVVVFEQPPEFLEVNPSSPPPFPPPSGYAWQDSIEIKNNSNQDIRLEHRVIPDNQNLERVFFSENPTVISFDANRSGVCLAGLEPVYPPYAAIQTSASWGDSFPAKITINGEVFTGNLFGDLADILAHQYNIYTGFERIYADFEGETDLVRVVFAGDVYAKNAEISLDFLSNIDIGVDSSFFYPENDTLQFNGNQASFNIGKLVCDIRVDQDAAVEWGNLTLVYGQSFDFKVGDRIGVNVLTERIAGAGIEDPADSCSVAASPELCVQFALLADLSEQWNPELKTINAKTHPNGKSRVIIPLNSDIGDDQGDPFATAKIVIQPSKDVPLRDMSFLGYAIPKCFVPR